MTMKYDYDEFDYGDDDQNYIKANKLIIVMMITTNL